MSEKWWPAETDTWASNQVKINLGDQIMKFLSVYHQYVAGIIIDHHMVAQDDALLYWIEKTTRHVANIFGLPVPGYARED